MPQPIPYLGFDGNCADAVRFYERVLGGKLELLLRGSDTPMAAEMPKEFLDRVMHARLALPGGGLLYAGDAPVGMYQGIKGISLTLNYDTTDEAKKIFDALADGGQVTMPLAPQFWAKLSGMLVDRFGTAWIVNGALVPM